MNSARADRVIALSGEGATTIASVCQVTSADITV